MRKQSNRSLRTKICSTTQQNFINGILSQKTIKWDPITEMHRGRERGQNIRDQIAEIVKAKIWLVYTSMTLCKNRIFEF